MKIGSKRTIRWRFVEIVNFPIDPLPSSVLSKKESLWPLIDSIKRKQLEIQVIIIKITIVVSFFPQLLLRDSELINLKISKNPLLILIEQDKGLGDNPFPIKVMILLSSTIMWATILVISPKIHFLKLSFRIGIIFEKPKHLNLHGQESTTLKVLLLSKLPEEKEFLALSKIKGSILNNLLIQTVIKVRGLWSILINRKKKVPKKRIVTHIKENKSKSLLFLRKIETHRVRWSQTFLPLKLQAPPKIKEIMALMTKKELNLTIFHHPRTKPCFRKTNPFLLRKIKEDSSLLKLLCLLIKIQK